jgi:5-methylcytosine-specific restriction endonuclease McrA
VTEEFRQCRRSSTCRESLPISQLRYENGSWLCEIGKCPRYAPSIEDSSYRVEKRYLNIANIMFLSSGASGQDPEDFADNFAARLEELTEEIISLNVEVYPLEGGYIGHAIEGSELIPKKTSKNRFRKQIFEEWDHRCAYCDKPADTLDHVIPKSKGGMTVKSNLIAACRICNGSKSDKHYKEWYRNQPFWDQARADVIEYWLENGTLNQ